MRLNCPNCDAEYVVDASLIPPNGRDVQCSNCETTWFQAGSRGGALESEDGDEDSPAFPDGIGAAAIAKATRDRPSRAIESEARSIIDEEVAFEETARAREAEPLERQEDLGLDEVTESGKDAAQAARERVVQAVKSGETPEPRSAADTASDEDGSGERFPDIDELNTKLESPEPDEEKGGEAIVDPATLAARRARGFRLGFGLMLMVAAALVLAYAYAPEISERMPDQATIVLSYVETVDKLRLWLDSTAARMVEQITALVGRISQDA